MCPRQAEVTVHKSHSANRFLERFTGSKGALAESSEEHSSNILHSPRRTFFSVSVPRRISRTERQRPSRPAKLSVHRGLRARKQSTSPSSRERNPRTSGFGRSDKIRPRLTVEEEQTALEFPDRCGRNPRHIALPPKSPARMGLLQSIAKEHRGLQQRRNPASPAAARTKAKKRRRPRQARQSWSARTQRPIEKKDYSP